MCSASLVDFLTDKLFSYSTKMKDETFKLGGTSFLMSSKINFQSQQLCPADLLSGLLENSSFNAEVSNSFMSLKHPQGFWGNNRSFSFLNTAKAFSPHLCNLVMDSYRYRLGFPDKPYLPSNNVLISQIMDSFLSNQSKLNHNFKTNRCLKETDCVTKMSVSVSHSTVKKSEVTNNKHSVPNSITLNVELTNRKTKKMHKRSKKRRRRQKKNQQTDGNSSASISDDENATPVSACVCLVSENTEFACAVSLSHSIQMSPNSLSSFVVSVDSASDDNSEWESYEVDQASLKQIINDCEASSVSNKEVDCNIVSSVSTLVKTESPGSKSSVDCDFQNLSSFISSFVVPVGNSSDDDSEWDSCETDTLNEDLDCEFTGMFVTNLCTPLTFSSDTDCSLSLPCEDDETKEIIKLRTILQNINKTWNECTKEVNKKPKLPSKVSFAPDEALVEVFSVEEYERRGEWEIYAIERIRFKRRINELEKVFSPCLNPEYRSKVFKELIEPSL